jgi:hypothetical protein
MHCAGIGGQEGSTLYYDDEEFCCISFNKLLFLGVKTMTTTSTTKMTAVMAAFVAAALVVPGAVLDQTAYAQNTSVNTDDDVTIQENRIEQKQKEVNSANAGNVKGDDNIVAGNTAAAVSFQDQEAFAANVNVDDDVFETFQLDLDLGNLLNGVNGDNGDDNNNNNDD